ncbi:MAG: hydrogenase nickel incorporation protein HypB [Spirochaetota bacterium]
MIINLRQNVLAAYSEQATEIRGMLARRDVYMVNLIGSPGSGKTLLLERTLERLSAHRRVAVIEGDVETQRDAERLERFGVPLVSVNTGGACHLEPHSVAGALEKLDLGDLDLVFVENVGNLICPVEFDLGENARVAVSSLPEGEDKPTKYPALFREASAVVLNKSDLAPHLPFDPAFYRSEVRRLNGKAPLFELSAATGAGVDAWVEWLLSRGGDGRDAVDGDAGNRDAGNRDAGGGERS